jgi:hypothetical protein
MLQVSAHLMQAAISLPLLWSNAAINTRMVQVMNSLSATLLVPLSEEILLEEFMILTTPAYPSTYLLTVSLSFGKISAALLTTSALPDFLKSLLEMPQLLPLSTFGNKSGSIFRASLDNLSIPSMT